MFISNRCKTVKIQNKVIREKPNGWLESCFGPIVKLVWKVVQIGLSTCLLHNNLKWTDEDIWQKGFFKRIYTLISPDFRQTLVQRELWYVFFSNHPHRFACSRKMLCKRDLIGRKCITLHTNFTISIPGKQGGHAWRDLFCHKVMHDSLPSAYVHHSPHHNSRKQKIDDETLFLRVSSSISTEIYLYFIYDFFNITTSVEYSSYCNCLLLVIHKIIHNEVAHRELMHFHRMSRLPFN